MSIFDQFNANPYIRTYAGAPINEAMQVAGALQQRAETNIANMDKMMLMADSMPTTGEADKAYKAQYMADLNRQIEEISQAPEHGTAKVRRLATRTAMDPTLKSIQATSAASAKWQSEYAKDPAKYGDVAAWEFQQALQAYEDAGGAAGGATFRAPQLTELMDVNKFFLDNGSKIAASQEGVAFQDGKFIHETTREELSPERVHAILKGAAGMNPQLMTQMQRQLNMENAMRVDGSKVGLEEYLDAQVTPYSGMFAFSKGTHKMKALPKGEGGGGFGFTGIGGAHTTLGSDIKFDMSGGEPEDAADWINKKKELEKGGRLEQQTAINMQAAWDRAVDKYAVEENLDPIEIEILKSGDLELLPKPTEKQNVVKYSGMGYSGGVITTNTPDASAVRKYLQDQGYTAEQVDKYSSHLVKAMNSSILQNNILDSYKEASLLKMDTKYQQTASTLGFTQRQEAAMNDMLRINLATNDAIYIADEDGNMVEYGSEDFKDEYDVSSARLVAHDINGTGAMQLEIKNDKGETELKTVQTDPDKNNVWRYISNQYAMIANDDSYPEHVRLDAATAAMNVTYPQIAQTAEMAYENPGKAVPLMFDNLNDIITQRHGTITMLYNVDGDLEVLKNGTNLFENSPEFANLAARSNSPQQLAAITLQYLQQNL